MNLNKPRNNNKLNTGDLPVTYGKANSEYIPLFTIIDQLPSPFFNSYGFTNNNFIGISDDKFKNITIKYGDKNINRWLYTLLTRLNGIRNSSLELIKRSMVDYHKIATDWIFSEPLNNYIVNYRNGRTPYWDKLVEDFKQSRTYLSNWIFVDTPIESTYGYIAEIVDKKIHSPLICLMVKKENIPFVRANWLMEIPIPEGIIEGWVLDEIDSPKYPKQSLRKNFKEKIFPEITNQGIPIIKKTREEMNGIWFHYKEPVFKTIAARNKWLEELSKKFIIAEKQRLQIAEKPKFSFSSVKTGIREPIVIEDGILSATIGIDPASNDVTITSNNEETSQVLIRGRGLSETIGYQDNIYRSLTLENLRQMMEDISTRSRTIPYFPDEENRPF